MLLIIYFILLSITIFAGLYNRKKFDNSIYAYFFWYLLFILFTESLSQILREYNLIIYNFHALVSFSFYFLFFKQIFKAKKNRQIMLVFLTVFLLFLLFDIFVLTKSIYYKLLNNTIVFGSFLTVITLILFLFEIIKNESIVFNIKKTFVFWISVGLLLFNIGILPIMITINYLNVGNNEIYSVIIAVLNYIMLCCFTFGYIYADKKYNY